MIRRAAVLFREAARPESLGRTRATRIWAAISCAVAQTPAPRAIDRRPSLVRWGWIAALGLTASATAAVAVRQVSPWNDVAPTVTSTEPRPLRPMPWNESAGSSEPAHPAGAVSADKRALRRQPARASDESALVAETKLLWQAVTSLRRQPEQALVPLDEHRRRFPHGALAGEATVVRVEALLALDRTSEALDLLDRLHLRRLPRTHDLRVLRADLRARNGRCAEALSDFDLVLGGSDPHPTLVEQALHGRAVCRSKLGDRLGAESDARAYKRRFPSGRFITPMDKLLR